MAPKPHAIVFAYPYQGHITPMMNLSIKLASKGFIITYVQTEFIHHMTLSKSHDHIQDLSGLDIRHTTISDGFPIEFDRDLNFNEYWESMMSDFPARVDELIEGIKRSGCDDPTAGVYFLIADSLYSWPAMIAEKHKLVHVSLWTEPAAVFCICYNLDLLRQNGHLPFTGNDGNVTINYIPGVESICRKDLMSYIQEPDFIPVVFKIVVKAFDQVKNADFILCNTVQELESQPLLTLNHNRPTYAIGPINFYNDFTNTIGAKTLWPESDCSEWLSSKAHGSVLYISFGSIAQISKHDIVEIAHGLLISQVNFIWVLRPDIMALNEDDVLPVGFEDDVKDRGVIVPWCNQELVLSSSAIGGFVTHCGWNSILESMYNGVPMICYPFFVDQPTNRKLVVNDWKIGINLCDGEHVTREEIACKINMLMNDECIELRKEIKKMSMALRNALDVEGSSNINFDRFVEDLKAKLYE